MNTIQIANILLTRKCNLSCDYCSIVKDYIGKPNEYPDMKYYYQNEIPYTEWMKRFEILKKNNPNIFFILYGGEPFCYTQLQELLLEMHKSDMNYTVISNNTDALQEKIYEIGNKIGGYRGFTSSVDPVIFSNFKDGDRYEKSIAAFTRLEAIKKTHLSEDVVAEITVDKHNIQFLYQTVMELTRKGIWSSITAIDDTKSSYYDFSAISDKSMLLRKDEQTKEDLLKIVNNDQPLLVHIPELLLKLYEDLPSNMRCHMYKNIHNITIDSDGSVRLCLRIRGIELPKNNFFNLFDENGKVKDLFKEKLEKDYSTLCRGCNHTCIYMSAYYGNSVINH